MVDLVAETITSRQKTTTRRQILSTVAATDQRRLRLRELIRQKGFVSIPDLRSTLDVSESTIRRDLDYLEAEGEAKRTHGGVFTTGPTSSLGVFETRRDEQWEKKRLIAEAASELIDDHDTILLDGGSTTYELARQLVQSPLQVVTNSLPLANLFSTTEQVDLVLLGGYVHNRTGVSLGPYANDMLRSLNVQTAVLSIAGADQRGFYNSNLLLVETERAMMEAADKTIVVADSSKFGKSSLARMCTLEEVDIVVTDDELTEDWRQRLISAGVELVVAQLGSNTDQAADTA